MVLRLRTQTLRPTARTDANWRKNEEDAGERVSEWEREREREDEDEPRGLKKIHRFEAEGETKKGWNALKATVFEEQKKKNSAF